MRHTVSVNVNGLPRELLVEPSDTLFDVLRGELDLTGAKEGCDRIGECGTCTIIMDGRAVLSCLILAVDADGSDILTIEGLSTGDTLHPIQEAFVEHGAFQCGFCTPGLVMTVKDFLDKTPHPSAEEIRDAIKGNLCRCTGYAKIIEAVEELADGDQGDDSGR